MSNKQIIINSDIDIKAKVYALILCIAGDFETTTSKILSKFNLSKLQLDILHELHTANGNMLTITEIKDRMVSDSPNVSRSVNKLMENEFIEKERTLVDQRVVNVKITDKGKDVHAKADKAKISLIYKNYKNNLSDNEIKTLYEILAKI